MTTYREYERRCAGCGEPFWGGRRARYCSSGCRSRAWRYEQNQQKLSELGDICDELLRRRDKGLASASKLLPRLFRATAAELRMRGWDPVELLITRPDAPCGVDEHAAGGIDGVAPERRRWLFPPEVELERLEREIREREQAGLPVSWHQARRDALRAALAQRETDLSELFAAL